MSSYSDNPYEHSFVVAEQGVETRVAFLKKVYGHVFGAILALCGLIAFFYNTGIAERILQFAFGVSAWGPMVFVFGFMAVSWIAHKMAFSQASIGTQYAGLAIYTVAEAIFLTPIIVYAAVILKAPDLIAQAGVLTLTIFGGLTAVVFMTKADFGFLKGIVVVGSFAALGLIVLSFIPGLGISLGGIWFSALLVGLMAITILWETSEIYHRFPESAYVGAALALFSSVATLFYYILRILIALNDD